MGDETKTDETKPNEAPEGGPTPERRDEDGLPIDRKPTLDDVRGGGGSGRTTAVSCTVVVLLLVAAFWLLRAVVMR
jgi:hypothetical protein